MEFTSEIYEWADIELQIAGLNITGFTAVKYKTSAEQEPIYAKGRKPIKIATGNFAFEGEFKLLQSAHKELKRRYGNKLFTTSFSAVVTYGNPSEGTPMSADIIEGFKFTETEKGMNQGDKKMEITMPFVALNVRENA